MKISQALKVGFFVVTSFNLSSCACVCANEICSDVNRTTTTQVRNADFGIGGTSDSGTAGALETIHFNYKQSALSASELTRVRSNAEWLKANPGVKVLLEGHGDRVGSEGYNLELSKARVETVRELLIKDGVDRARLKLKSIGQSQPVTTPVSKSKFETGVDRRVNFVIESID